MNAAKQISSAVPNSNNNFVNDFAFANSHNTSLTILEAIQS